MKDKSIWGRMLRQLIVLLIWLPMFAESKVPDVLEHEVKAAYLYNFTQFITWPTGKLAQANTSFEICIIGSDPFGSALEPLAHRTRNGQLIRLNYPENIDSALNCNLLYIALSENQNVKKILALLQNKPIVTVSSIPNFVRKGGSIGFIKQGKHVRFEINYGACTHNGLVCGAKLLEAAVLVVGRKDK